ncbi:50S ribosomal protein L4 [Candidatus Poribacteria bacterium]|nr:50S ribosomal protein L4 [Candidatus Poribacteria bacterium]
MVCWLLEKRLSLRIDVFMPKLDVYDRLGKVVSQKELSERFVSMPVNAPVVHKCVVAYLANQRRGTASTKIRSEVKGSGRKLYRQKGTGRARVGDVKSPIRVGGGVAFGPRPRSFRIDLPKKVRRLGMKSILADVFQSECYRLVQDFSMEVPKTKELVEFLDVLNLEGKTLIVLGDYDPNIHLSARNIRGVNSCTWDLLNVYEMLWHDNIVVMESAVDKLEQKYAS